MRALDTNVVVRLVVNDHPEQYAAARALFARGEQLLVAPTVLLETEWVLRDVYGLSQRKILTAFAALCATEHVVVGSAEAVAEALRLAAAGVELADALHLAIAAGEKARALMSFDRGLARKANKAAAQIPVAQP